MQRFPCRHCIRLCKQGCYIFRGVLMLFVLLQHFLLYRPMLLNNPLVMHDRMVFALALQGEEIAMTIENP